MRSSTTFLFIHNGVNTNYPVGSSSCGEVVRENLQLLAVRNFIGMSIGSAAQLQMHKAKVHIQLMILFAGFLWFVHIGQIIQII